MKTENIKKYTKLVLALVAAGVISGGTTYWLSTVKNQNDRKSEVFKSIHEGKFLSEKVGKNVLMLGQNYLGQETLNEAQFLNLMETKNEFGAWIAKISDEPEFKEEAVVLQESWKDLSDQLDFLNNFYKSSVKSITNQTESMMVTRKNRAFLISESSDNLPNDVPYGAVDTISNQKLEYNSPLKQTLRNQVEKTIASYVTNSETIGKALDKVVKSAGSNDASIKSEAMMSYIYISLVGFILISLSIMLLGGGSGRSKKDVLAEEELFLILNNVKEGMFVMNPAWEITGNISGSLGDVLNKEFVVGDNFFTFIQSSLDQKNASLAKDYLKLLIEKNLNEKLVSSVNPLKLINVGSPSSPRMVSINLSPIKGTGVVEKVLVTVFDASEQKKLEDTVRTEKTKSSNQFDFLLKIMKSKEQILYVQFFHKLQEVICDQNEKLKTAKTDEQSLRDLLVNMQGEIHTLKAQAGILELGLYQQMLHDFEGLIFDIKKKAPLKAEDMHTLSFFHKDFLEKTSGLISALEIALQNNLKGQTAEDAALSVGASLPGFGDTPSIVPEPIKKVESDSIPFFQGTSSLDTGGLSLLDDSMTSDLGIQGMSLDSLSSSVKPSDSLLSDLLVLVKNASDKMEKKVNLSINLSAYDLVGDEKRDSLRSILMHLVNNSVAHGVESVKERESKNKYPVGVIQIFDEIKMDNFQEVVTVYVVDDGAGLNVEKIKARAIDLGMDIGDASPSKLIPLIFEPDFTTKETEDFFSGRGVGLSFVKSEVEKLGGSINMKMRPGNYIEFSFKFNLADF